MHSATTSADSCGCERKRSRLITGSVAPKSVMLCTNHYNGAELRQLRSASRKGGRLEGDQGKMRACKTRGRAHDRVISHGTDRQSPPADLYGGLMAATTLARSLLPVTNGPLASEPLANDISAHQNPCNAYTSPRAGSCGPFGATVRLGEDRVGVPAMQWR